MKRQRMAQTAAGITLAGLTLTGAPGALADDEFEVVEPIIEINATDGDIGFHVLLDGSAWRAAKLYQPDDGRILKATGTQALMDQGITEMFMESAEPPCNPDDADEDEEAVDLAEFLDRFPAGVYDARGWSLEGEEITGAGTFTHNIPAAPNAEVDVAIDGDDVAVTLSWESGEDLGRCEFQALVDDGAIPAPAEVEVARWEVVVEPEEDELPDDVAFAKFTMQFLPDVGEVEVPAEYFASYLDAGVTEFKGEVGAREVSGNQTFTEFEFSLEEEEE